VTPSNFKWVRRFDQSERGEGDMTKKRLPHPYVVIFALWVGLLPAFSVMAEEVRVAAVNSERIMRESGPAKAAQAKLEEEFSKRDKELKELADRIKVMVEKQDKDMANLSEAERIRKGRELAELDRELQRRQREFREDISQRRSEELSAVLDRANRVIRQIAEQKHYDLIVQEGAYVSPRIDITDEVLRVLDGSK